MNKSKQVDPAVDSLSEEELADYLYEHRDDEAVWKPTFRKLTPSGTNTAVFQMRIPGKDLDEIAKAAYANGGNVSEFFRSAALEKARGLNAAAPSEVSPEALTRARELVQELEKQLGVNKAPIGRAARGRSA
jgi:uncharacterized protein (DUF1778 family)